MLSEAKHLAGIPDNVIAVRSQTLRSAQGDIFTRLWRYTRSTPVASDRANKIDFTRYNARMVTLKEADLPLRYKTPVEWAREVLTEPLELLNDHAHLEKKAAANALELLNRWPEPNPPENWVTAMTAVAKDEVEHLAVVTRLIARRGGRLTRNHGNKYAADLRALARMGQGPNEIVDRLMISALIEARSCERFFLLTQACDDAVLVKLYKGLWASEHGHYRTFIDLAEQLESERKVERRWNEMLDLEAKIIQKQPPGPRMHSGL